jgi:hypothetical protein
MIASYLGLTGNIKGGKQITFVNKIDIDQWHFLFYLNGNRWVGTFESVKIRTMET